MRRTVFSSGFFLFSCLATGNASAALAASSDAAEIQELRREMVAMRRELMGQISSLKVRLAKSEARTNRNNQKKIAALAAPLPATELSEQKVRHVVSGPSDPAIKFSDSASQYNILRLSEIGTPPSDRGVVESWKHFHWATQKDENVRVGGMIIGFPRGRFTIASADAAYAFSVGLALHEDIGGFFGMSPRPGETKGNFPGLTQNLRRLRLPVSFRYKNWIANVTPDWGSSSSDGKVSLYEANINYTGFSHTYVTVGYFQPRVTFYDSQSSNNFQMLERPGITNIVRNIAAGDSRFSAGALHYEKRWWIAGYFTGQSYGTRGNDSTVSDSQTGATLRVAGRPYISKNVDIHVGISALSAFKTTQNSAGRRYSPGEATEAGLTGTKLISATVSNTGPVWAAGPELGLRWRRLIMIGEYYHIGVQRSERGLPVVNFDGYYGEATYTILGKPRAYDIRQGAFSAPGVEADFDPQHGQWGALEVSGRYSVADLNDLSAGIRGGKQTVWAGGVNWYPNRHFRVMLDYNHFIVTRNQLPYNISGRNGNSVVTRLQAAF